MENYLNDFYYFKQACPKVATNIVRICNYALGEIWTRWNSKYSCSTSQNVDLV